VFCGTGASPLMRSSERQKDIKMTTNDTRAPVVLVEQLRLKVSFNDYTAVARALAERIEREGVRSLMFIQQYARAESNDVAAVLVFTDPRAMVSHVGMIETWHEFHALLAMVEVTEIRVLGPLPDDVARWLAKFHSKALRFGVPIAGFSRSDGC
jgi:hypothetical protein